MWTCLKQFVFVTSSVSTHSHRVREEIQAVCSEQGHV